jgi:hypothetical protein
MHGYGLAADLFTVRMRRCTRVQNAVLPFDGPPLKAGSMPVRMIEDFAVLSVR